MVIRDMKNLNSKFLKGFMQKNRKILTGQTSKEITECCLLVKNFELIQYDHNLAFEFYQSLIQTTKDVFYPH